MKFLVGERMLTVIAISSCDTYKSHKFEKVSFIVVYMKRVTLVLE